MSAEFGTPIQLSVEAGNAQQQEEALRQQALLDVEQRAANMAVQPEAAHTDLFAATAHQQAEGAHAELGSALFQQDSTAEVAPGDPLVSVYDAIGNDSGDAVDAKAGNTLESMLRDGQVPADAARATEAARLLAAYGAYKFSAHGNVDQLNQALNVMAAYTEQVPGFDPNAAGLLEVKENLVASLAAAQADAKSKPNYQYAKPERQLRADEAAAALGRVCQIEARAGSSAEYSTDLEPTAEVDEPLDVATAGDLKDYIDYLRSDLDEPAWKGDEKAGQRTFIDAIGRAMDEAGPGADPRDVVDARLAQLSRVKPPTLPAARAQYDFQVGQLKKLSSLVHTNEGAFTMRESVADWRESFGQQGTVPEAAPATASETAVLPEVGRTMTVQEVELAREGLSKVVVSGGRHRKPESTQPAAPQPVAPEAEAAEDLTITDFEALDPAQRKEAARKLIDSMYAKYGSKPLTPAERKAWLDGTGENFSGDPLQKAQDILAHAPTQGERDALTRATLALGPLQREGDAQAQALAREISPLDRHNNLSSDDPQQLEQILTAIGFRPERTARIVDALRATQARQRPGDKKARVAITFSRDSSEPYPMGKLDDQPMFALTQVD